MELLGCFEGHHCCLFTVKHEEMTGKHNKLTYFKLWYMYITIQTYTLHIEHKASLKTAPRCPANMNSEMANLLHGSFQSWTYYFTQTVESHRRVTWKLLFICLVSGAEFTMQSSLCCCYICRCAMLCCSAYVSLGLGDNVTALEHAQRLLEHTNMSGSHKWVKKQIHWLHWIE